MVSGPSRWLGYGDRCLPVLRSHREEPPLARNALELVGAPVGQVDPRTHHEVLDRSRDEHLARPRVGADSSRDVNRHAAEIIADHLALSGVKTRPDLDPELAQLLTD